MSELMTATTNLMSIPQEQVALIKRTICKGATDDELALFIGQCKRTGLDPFSKQIHAIKRWDSREKREVMAVQVGIDGLRIVAERSDEMDGQEGPFWCGKDGVWKDSWLSTEPPIAAKTLVFRKGRSHPYVGFARYDAYVQRKQDGGPNVFWGRMPDVMLAKCSEALALRKAFPNDLSGLYIAEEMGNDKDDSHAGENHTPKPATPPSTNGHANGTNGSAPVSPPAKTTEEKAAWYMAAINRVDTQTARTPADQLVYLANGIKAGNFPEATDCELRYLLAFKAVTLADSGKLEVIDQELANQSFTQEQTDRLVQAMADRRSALVSPPQGSNPDDDECPF